MPVRSFVLLAVVLALGSGGCAALSPEPRDETADLRPPHKPPPPRPPAPESAALIKHPGHKPPEPSVPAPAARPAGVAGLAGHTEDEVRLALGAPAAVVERPPAVVWTYESAGCRLDVSFFMDVASETFRVLATEATPKGKDGLAGDDCVGALRMATR